jgi:malate dehydrogenase (oxaloacetate-decarboxylating)
MRAALDIRARCISIGMCLSASHAIADAVPASELGPDKILPSPFDDDLYPSIAEAVARQGISEGQARVSPAPGVVAESTRRLQSNVALRQKELLSFRNRPG